LGERQRSPFAFTRVWVPSGLETLIKPRSMKKFGVLCSLVPDRVATFQTTERLPEILEFSSLKFVYHLSE